MQLFYKLPVSDTINRVYFNLTFHRNFILKYTSSLSDHEILSVCRKYGSTKVSTTLTKLHRTSFQDKLAIKLRLYVLFCIILPDEKK